MERASFLPELEVGIGYRFHDPKLLETALTHSSFANEQSGEDIESFERLEFLGDAVTGLEVAFLIFEQGPLLSEGQMTATRAALVRSEGLASIARSIGLGAYLRLGVGADRTDVRENDAVLEDAFEALMAAVFLDGGSEAARGVIRNLFTGSVEEKIHMIEDDGLSEDFKTRLQIEMQKKGAADIRYVLLCEVGPDHDKTFSSAVFCDGKQLGEGEGKTKKHAEKMAAKMALEGLNCI